jgi:hypothetical protein
MKPGEVYKVTFDVGWLSQIFNKGPSHPRHGS